MTQPPLIEPPPIAPTDPPGPLACARCGQAHARCTGHSRRNNGGPCNGWPVKGATVCVTHGGAAPQVRRAAAARVEQARAEAAVRTLGLPDDRPPDEAILSEFAWTLGHVTWLRARVQELAPRALVWGVQSKVDKQTSEWPGVDTTKVASPSVWLELYARERKHLLELFKAIKAASLDERRLEFARSTMAPQIAAVIAEVVDGLGLSAEQVALVPGLIEGAVRRRLLGGPAVIEGRTTG